MLIATIAKKMYKPFFASKVLLALIASILCLLIHPAFAIASDLTASVETQTYQSNIGWRAPVLSGTTTGGDGHGIAIQALRMTLHTPNNISGLTYSVYQNDNWGPTVQSGEIAGDSNSPIQGIRAQLSGEAAANYTLFYRSFCTASGWLGWTSDYNVSGSPGFLSVEAVQVKLVPKGTPPFSSGGAATVSAPRIHFYGYVQDSGWVGPLNSSNGVGASGKALQGFKATITGAEDRLPGSISYRVRTKSGWLSWVSDGQEACPIASSAPIQAIEIRLEGTISGVYDLWYHVFTPGLGWMGYTKNGASAGTSGLGLIANAVQIWLTSKGSAAPGSTSFPFRDLSNTTKIGWQNPKGRPQVSARSVVLPSYCTGYFTYVTPSRISVNASREECVQAFINRAKEYLGTPYIEPYSCQPGVGVDCSGLVLQCLYACGVDMGWYNPYNHRWLPEQVYNSMNWYKNQTFQPIALSDRRAGDVLYYQGHIAIYLGNDQIIDAYPPRVSIRSMWYAKPIGAARPFV